MDLAGNVLVAGTANNTINEAQPSFAVSVPPLGGVVPAVAPDR
jgi:hypothetical protein